MLTCALLLAAGAIVGGILLALLRLASALSQHIDRIDLMEDEYEK